MVELTEQEVRDWLKDYAWLNEPEEAKLREIDCIIAQGTWRYIDAIADKFAGAQWEPGPEAYSEGTLFALSALYECHDAPHLETCPRRK